MLSKGHTQRPSACLTAEMTVSSSSGLACVHANGMWQAWAATKHRHFYGSNVRQPRQKTDNAPQEPHPNLDMRTLRAQHGVVQEICVACRPRMPRTPFALTRNRPRPAHLLQKGLQVQLDHVVVQQVFLQVGI